MRFSTVQDSRAVQDVRTCGPQGYDSRGSFVLPGSQLCCGLGSDVGVVGPHEQSGPLEGQRGVVGHAYQSCDVM